MTTSRGWAIIAVVFVLACVALLRWGPTEHAPEKPVEAARTGEPGPPARIALGGALGPYGATETALRTRPDPLAGFEGRYACRFATAGRSTPCCPDAVPVLTQYWTGADLAVADFLVGRESGCRAGIVNSSGCVGWFQLCDWRCDGPCTDGAANAEKAHQLWEQFGWCSTASWYLAGDPVTGRGGAACA